MSNLQTPLGELLVAEMKEFGTFHKKTQRFIRQSLDVAYNRGDVLAKWGRTQDERDNIRLQQHNYQLLLDRIRLRLDRAGGVSIGHIEWVMGPLVALATFDLSCGKLPGFGPFRFLYERLFGAEVRPWLPSVYVAAAAMPVHHRNDRKNLLHAISESACCNDGWSSLDPMFMPEWVDKVDMNPPPEQKKLPPPPPPPSDEQQPPLPPKEDA
jgi:hypothetical protein